MYCTKCGKEIPDGSKFCKYCGAPVTPQAPQKPAAQPKPKKQPAPPAAGGQPEQPRRGKKWPWVALVCLLCAAALGTGAWFFLQGRSHDGFEAYYEPLSQEDVVTDAETPYVDSQLLLTAEPGVPFKSVKSLVGGYGGEIVGYISISNDYQIAFPDGKDYDALAAVAGELGENELVDEVMLNYAAELSPCAVDYTADPWTVTGDAADSSGSVWTEDVSEGSNWWAEAIGLPAVWQSDTDFSEVKVGVIDTMFDADSADLAGRFDKLWNEPDGVAQLYEDHRTDNSFFHGTHVAGLIAAAGGNGSGITGAAQNVRLYGYAVSADAAEGWSALPWDSIFQFKYATALMLNEGVRIINISMAFSGLLQRASAGDESALRTLATFSSSMEDFLDSCLDAGYDFLIVKAAGNDRGCDAQFDVWGMFKGEKAAQRVLVVGAAENHRYFYAPAAFSNTGSRVDVYAPGVDVLSLLPGDTTGLMSGTSMAAPIVTGVAALVWGADPTLTGPEVARIVTAACTPALTGEEAAELGRALGQDADDVQAEPVQIVDAAAAVELALAGRSGQTPEGGEEPAPETGILLGVAYCYTDARATELFDVTVRVYDGAGNEAAAAQKPAAGGYSFVLPAGAYRVEASAEGCETAAMDVTVNAGQTVQQNIRLQPEGGAEPVAVQDAYTYMGILKSDYDSAYDEQIEYHVPRIVLEGVDTDEVNAQLWQELYEQDIVQTGALDTQEFYTGVLTEEYEWYVNGDVLSLVVTEYWGPEDHMYRHKVYNISVSDGTFLSTEQVLTEAGVPYDVHWEGVRRVLENYVNAFYSRPGSSGTDWQMALSETLEPEHVAQSCPFIDESGGVCVLASLYYCYAPFESYGFLFNMRTGEAFGAQAELCQMDELDVAGTVQTAPADSGGSVTWEVYNAEYDQLELDPVSHRFVATVNLLELYGTVTGTYSEDSAGKMDFQIEQKNFDQGFADGDATAFSLQRQGDQLTVPQTIWNMYPGSTVFAYDRSFTVYPDSGSGTVTGNSVRFRSAPSTEDLILFELNKGDHVTITGRTSDWYRVEYTYNGVVSAGYMSADYVEKNG